MGEQGRRRDKKLLSYQAGIWLVLFAVFPWLPWHLSCPPCHPGVLQRHPMGTPAVYSILIYSLIFSLKSCPWWAHLSLLVLGFSCHDGKPSWVLIKYIGPGRFPSQPIQAHGREDELNPTAFRILSISSLDAVTTSWFVKFQTPRSTCPALPSILQLCPTCVTSIRMGW